MRVIPTPLGGVTLVEPETKSDSRGGFFEAWHALRYAAAGLPGEFRQVNVSSSNRGVLRGLHLQHPGDQAKLVTAVHGAVFDVAVDVRRGSPTFGQWFGVELTGDNARQLFVPVGFAHGFLALAEHSVVMYLASSIYQPGSEIVVRWDDPALRIDWPSAPEVLSPRDAAAPTLGEVNDRLPLYQG